MDYYELIKNRRSIRSYDKTKKIPPEVLERILEAGRLAPTAANRQPARIIVVENQKNLDKIAPCYAANWFADAPVVLVVLGKREDAWVRKSDGFNSLEIDCTIVMDHMILAAEYEGLATCWIAAFNDQPLREPLDIDDDEFICCLTPLGYLPENAKKPPMTKRKNLDQLVSYK